MSGHKSFKITGVLKGKYEIRDDKGKFSLLNKRQLEKKKKEFPNWEVDF